MRSLLKSTVMGVGLLAAVTVTANAQSVSALPPTSPETAPTATTMPPVSADKITPNPGNNAAWQEQHYTATPPNDDPATHPYSAPHFAPAPN
jgi:hypothetical protein